MKNVALILASVVLAFFGGLVVIVNRQHLTTPMLAYSGVLLLLAFAAAFPANAKDALTTVAPYLPFGSKPTDKG